MYPHPNLAPPLPPRAPRRRGPEAAAGAQAALLMPGDDALFFPAAHDDGSEGVPAAQQRAWRTSLASGFWSLTRSLVGPLGEPVAGSLTN